MLSPRLSGLVGIVLLGIFIASGIVISVDAKYVLRAYCSFLPLYKLDGGPSLFLDKL